MTETRAGLSPSAEEDSHEPTQPLEAELEAAREPARQARARGVGSSGPDGLLKALTEAVIETALDEQMNEHVSYDEHAADGRNRGNSRKGTRSKTVLTDTRDEVQIDVPRDRDGTFNR